MKEQWDVNALKKIFPDHNLPNMVLALEFEENLVDWSNAPYEIQIYIS